MPHDWNKDENNPNRTLAEDIADIQALAIEQIGRQTDEDYRIAPSSFVKTTEKASELSLLLDNDRLKSIATRYEKYNKEALSFQEKFKTGFGRATKALLATGFFGAIQPLFESYSPAEWIFGGLALFSGAYAMYQLHYVQSESLLKSWMSNRAKAETERLGYFYTAVQEIKKRAADNVVIQVQFCEFFRRYQNGIQLRYYEQQSKAHRKNATRTSKIAAAGAVFAWVGAGVGGLLGDFVTSIPLASLGCIGTAVSLFASRREEMTQDGRNSERYERTWDALSKLDGYHCDVITKLTPYGDVNTVETYVEAIHNLLSVEHRQWLDNIEEMGPAIQSLVKLHQSNQ